MKQSTNDRCWLVFRCSPDVLDLAQERRPDSERSQAVGKRGNGSDDLRL